MYYKKKNKDSFDINKENLQKRGGNISLSLQKQNHSLEKSKKELEQSQGEREAFKEALRQAAPSKISTIKTYQDDLAKVMKAENTSVADIALIEKKKWQEDQKASELDKQNHSNRRSIKNDRVVFKSKNNSLQKDALVILASLLFLVLGGAAAYIAVFGFSFWQVENGQETKTQTVLQPSLVLFDEQIVVDLEKNSSIKEVVKEEGGKKISSGSIRHIFLRENNTGVATSRLFEEIRAHPPLLERALHPQFTLGIYAISGNKSELFYIFSVKSYEDAFASMLSWENRMPADLQSFLAKEEGSIKKGDFFDVLIKNKDARILYEDENGEAIAYSFPRKDRLIITTNQQVLAELLDRLK